METWTASAVRQFEETLRRDIFSRAFNRVIIFTDAATAPLKLLVLQYYPTTKKLQSSHVSCLKFSVRLTEMCRC